MHPEEDWLALGSGERRCKAVWNRWDAVLADCNEVLEHAYHMRSFNQAMMETFRTYTELDRYGRLHVISSTQIVFHVRRILSRALGIPKSKIRVGKAQDRRRIRCKTDGGKRGLSRVCHTENRTPGTAHFYEGGESDCRISPGMKWRCACGWERIRMDTSGDWICIHYPIPVLMASMVRRR